MPFSVKHERWTGDGCTVCEGTGFLPRQWVTGLRECTCGAGPLDELTLHAAGCDSVPCPFDQLLPGRPQPRVVR